MHDKSRIVSAWLTREDDVCRKGRVARLRWISSIVPTGKYWAFHGGILAKYQFEEMRYSFVYGQYLASIMLGLAYIERTLAAKFYAAGRNDLERSGLAQLLRQARECGLLTEREFREVDRIRRVRNPVAHFRRPVSKDSIDVRAVMGNAHPYAVLERDARAVLRAVMRTLKRDTV